jgi:hypothetical protein
MKRDLRATIVMAVVCAVAWAVPVRAHHSFAVYDRTKTLNVKGTVKTFQWTNPHVVIWVVVQPAGGGAPEEWSFETTSPGVLTRSGWTRHSVNPGDHVSIDYHPLRDGSHGGGIEAVTLTDTGQKLEVQFQEKPGLQ